MNSDHSEQQSDEFDNDSEANHDSPSSWSNIYSSLAKIRQKASLYHCRGIGKTVIRPLGEKKVRIYFLAVKPGQEVIKQSLFAVDVTYDYDTKRSNEMENSKSWITLIDATNPATFNQRDTHLSREEELLRERMRSFFQGLNDFDVHVKTGVIVFSCRNIIFFFQDNHLVGFASPEPIVCTGTCVLEVKICPTNPMIVSYVSGGELWLVHLLTKSQTKITDCSVEGGISVGLPSYVMQEEFDRFTGYWWQPVSRRNIFGCSHCILFEIVDESAVDNVDIVSPMDAGRTLESYRYPRAGKLNAKSSFSLAMFDLHSDTCEILNLKIVPIKTNLWSEWEYIVRIGWTPDGKAFWTQCLNRLQDKLNIYLFLYKQETKSFVPVLLHQEKSPTWIEMHECTYFFNLSEDGNSVDFIWASEETEYRHLYHFSVEFGEACANSVVDLGDVVTGKVVSKRQLTSGNWPVLPTEIWVSTKHKLVYFHSLMIDPRCEQLCATSYVHQNWIDTVSSPYMFESNKLDNGSETLSKSNRATVDPETGIVVVRTVCHKHAFKVTVNYLDSLIPHSNFNGPQLALRYCSTLLTPFENDFFVTPEYFTFKTEDDYEIYGLIFKPVNIEEGKKYPTVLYVYGGPGVQLVTNTFVGHTYHRASKLCYLGYCVVIIDNRGSANRGRQFSGELKMKIGLVELKDQVAGLSHAAAQYGCIDLARVGIFGWSYGGYLALLAMRDYKSHFKVGIAGAPVTDWRLYDTGYTERYLGLPSSVYERSSALEDVESYPSKPNRLLIAHGSIDENVHFYHTSRLLDAFTTAGKPYQLLVYPNERHGLKSALSQEHFEASFVSFLNQYL